MGKVVIAVEGGSEVTLRQGTAPSEQLTSVKVRHKR